MADNDTYRFVIQINTDFKNKILIINFLINILLFIYNELKQTNLLLLLRKLNNLFYKINKIDWIALINIYLIKSSQTVEIFYKTEQHFF